MTLRRADSFMASCTGGCATSFRMPSMRRRMRYIFSYGSKWMSDAPRRMASSSSLLTKRTMGASSTSSRETPRLRRRRRRRVTSRFSRSKPFVVGELRHGRVGLLDGLVDGLLQLVVFDDDGLDAEAGLEFDLVDGVQVGRVRHREEQALAAPEQRQAAMLLQQLVLDQLDGLEVDVVRVEVEQRHAEFGRGGDGDVARLGGAGGDRAA